MLQATSPSNRRIAVQSILLYFDEIVAPNLDEFREYPRDLRRAINAVGSLCSLCNAVQAQAYDELQTCLLEQGECPQEVRHMMASRCHTFDMLFGAIHGNPRYRITAPANLSLPLTFGNDFVTRRDMRVLPRVEEAFAAWEELFRMMGWRNSGDAGKR